MTDTLSIAERSRLMSKIRGKNTGPERAVRSLLHRAGYRFRIHVRGLPGTP
ncbi:MAG: very short patch repair endonuclease, partial [Spartobacteria bacterium]|nr:very short patch repair endonuclease [Spartobacteria bacterium]